ncbi:MAG: hypothetical protein CMJ64_13220 [Planctomycetaceae bacterium]|nr:hypothetical protein [Planctomycetaceae bacterium]
MLRFFDRREFLRVGLTTAGLAVGAQHASANENQARVPRGFGRAKSVILVYASGGQSQFETWDPKPDAPLDVRGTFSPIATPLPGVQLCEYMPRLARLADRYTIVRSMSHEDLDHGTATYLALTGRYHRIRSGNPLPNPNDYPTYGAVLKRLRVTNRFAYEAVHLNAPAYVPFLISPGQDGGFLGREYEPLVVGDPRDSDAVLPGLTPQTDLPPVRLENRKTLKETLDNYRDRLAKEQKLADMSLLYQQALAMLSSSRYRDAFDLEKEPPALRDRYGRHRSGQSCLLARRLVEAGVPFINVIWNHSNRGQDRDPTDTDVYGWDTHNDIFDALKIHLLPRFDESFATLLEDLDERGLLEDTLVVCMGEFGRAPRVALEPNFAGNLPGRKHWAWVYSIVMAGAGVSRGAVLGASDRIGAEPATERYGPWDVAATMFSALGIDHASQYTDVLNRPVAATVGRPMEPLYG